MTREEIIKQFVKEHIHWIVTSDGKTSYDVFLVDFIISKITEAEDKAWEAARRTHNLFNCNSYFF